MVLSQSFSVFCALIARRCTRNCEGTEPGQLRPRGWRDVPDHRTWGWLYRLDCIGHEGWISLLRDGLGTGQWVISNFFVHRFSFLGFISVCLFVIFLCIAIISFLLILMIISIIKLSLTHRFYLFPLFCSPSHWEGVSSCWVLSCQLPLNHDTHSVSILKALSVCRRADCMVLNWRRSRKPHCSVSALPPCAYTQRTRPFIISIVTHSILVAATMPSKEMVFSYPSVQRCFVLMALPFSFVSLLPELLSWC